MRSTWPGPQPECRGVRLYRYLALAAFAIQLDFRQPLRRGGRSGQRKLHCAVNRLGLASAMAVVLSV